MAAVIHSLCEKGDRNPLIMPANIPIDDPRFFAIELTRYPSDQWDPIIETDVHGPGRCPVRIDREVPNLGSSCGPPRSPGRFISARRRRGAAANRGIEDRRIQLGCVMPGEVDRPSLAMPCAASRRATDLYQDGTRYWYATQPTVTKLADDRAEQFSASPIRSPRSSRSACAPISARLSISAAIHTIRRLK